MIGKKRSKTDFRKRVFGFFFAIIAMLGLMSNIVIPTGAVYADPPETTTVNVEATENNENQGENTGEDNSNVANTISTGDGCQNALGAIGWLVCPTTGAIAGAVDFLYGLIQDILAINPVEMKDGVPIYEIWKYCRGFANIVFIIFLLIVIYSQITGMGITNYGIKKALPKLIVVAILVNLSFLICSLAVDASNILGNSLRGLFTSVETSTMAGMDSVNAANVGVENAEMFSAIAGGTALTIGGTIIAFETGAIWMLIPIVLGAIVAVVTGLITIALRQAVVVLLVMIAPLAIVAYMLPNTENLFTKWRKLLTQMLVFYPMFSLLFGASSLAGFAIIMSATDGFGVLLGVAVQIFPLFFSWKLMQMSGTFLGTINAKMREIGNRPVAGSRALASSARTNKRVNTLINGTTPSARLMQYMHKRSALREEDTKNAVEILNSKTTEYVQRKIAGSEIGDITSGSNKASRYTRNAKRAQNSALISQNASAYTAHVLGNYGDYFNRDAKDVALNEEAKHAWIDYGRSVYQRELDDENDIQFLTDTYLAANKRDENNRPIDEVAFNRYVKSVATGPDGEQRLLAKVIAQAAKTESKRRAESDRLWDKYKFNGYNKGEFRSFAAGYYLDGDGWAIDRSGNRLRNADGSYVETIQGDALTKAPEKLVLYDKRDAHGLYFDMKDQDGNIVARIHRGVGADGIRHDDAPFMKEAFSNYDIPIGDPMNNVYSILAGINPGDIVTPQGQNDIGLAKYSTTIGKAMNAYKGDAAWSGAMFNSGISNRQIRNSAEYAIWALDSIKKTVKPGPFNVQSPSSIMFLKTILDPDNWGKIFTEEDIANAININNEPIGGEDWEMDENGVITGYTAVENPNHEQRMNTIMRKFLYPAMQKITPAFDRLRTSNTIDNQKPGTADAQYELLKMIEEKWEGNDAIKFDPTLVDQDLQSAARAFRQRKHDKDGNLIYASEPIHPRQSNGGVGNLLNMLEDVYDNCLTADELRANIFALLDSKDEYDRALQRFDELCNENPDATMEEIQDWFDDLDILVQR